MKKVEPMYIYATENINGYYQKLKLKNKKLLTITGSGDQIFNAYFFGAREVVGFDINSLSQFILHLKFASIKQINYKEFLEFFGKIAGKGNFNYMIYQKIRKKLEKKTRKFFDELYKKYNFNGAKLSKSKYFIQRKDFQSTPPTIINSYLRNEINYLKLKLILKNKKIKFIRRDVRKIFLDRQLFNKKFDVINLSNVPNYITGILKKEHIQKPEEYFFNEVILNLRKKLKEQGVIVYYSYSPNYVKKLQISPISKNYYLRKIKDKHIFNVTQWNIKGLAKETKDKIVVLEI